MTDEAKKAMIWHWDTVGECIYSGRQYEALSDEIKNRCTDISLYDWQQIRQNVPVGKHIGNNPDTNLPDYIDDPEPTDEEKAQQEITELKQYLSDTDYCAIKCSELGLSMASEYPEIYQKRIDARARINELETTSKSNITL